MANFGRRGAQFVKSGRRRSEAIWCAVPKEFWTGEACGQRLREIDKFKQEEMRLAGDRCLHRSQLRVEAAIPKEPTKPRWPVLEAISVVVGLFAAAATAASLVHVAGAISVGSWGGARSSR